MAGKEKWYRVAVEGDTTDGRTLKREWIEDMAASYDPNVYGARVWMEHNRGWTPDSPFRAYGDVIAAKSEEIELLGKKRVALYVQIKPTADLVAYNKASQKVFTSVEINPDFSDSGKAYLEGLAVTDSPASIGTDRLQFSSKCRDVLSRREINSENTYTEFVETELNFEDSDSKKFMELAKAKIQNLFKNKQNLNDEIKQLTELFSELIDQIEKQPAPTDYSARIGDLEKQITTTTEAFNAYRTEHDERAAQDKTPNPNYTQRPTAAGQATRLKTDC